MEIAIGLAPLWILLAGLLVSTIGLKLGARLAGVRAGWPRAFLAVLIIYPTGLFVFFFAALFLSPPMGLLAGMLAVLAVLKVLFAASWPRTLLVWLLVTLIQVLLFTGAAFLAGWGLQELIKQLNQYIPKRELEIGLGRFFPGVN